MNIFKSIFKNTVFLLGILLASTSFMLLTLVMVKTFEVVGLLIVVGLVCIIGVAGLVFIDLDYAKKVKAINKL